MNRTLVMGVLNITPDSFYTRSRYGLDKILTVAEQMVIDGVDIFDVGGESTRPRTTEKITCEQELERVIPVIEVLNKHFDQVISVDTSSALTIVEAAKAGASMINDVRALNMPGALAAAAKIDLPVILMHSLINQPQPSFIPHYDNVIQEVYNYLKQRIGACESVGIVRERLLVDPGFGGGMFGKTPAHNLSLLKNIDKFSELGLPILAGMSRKSFIGSVINKPASQRLSASLTVAVIAAVAGAYIVRVHDVAETSDAIRMVNAVRSAE